MPQPQLYNYYKTTVVEQLMKSGRYTNRLQVPKLQKIVINMGISSRFDNVKEVIAEAEQELANITGQKPVVTLARKSISNFKVRKGMPVGCKVTLRGARMYEFLERFLNAALPRIRDFRGVSPRSFDGRGNYTIGVKDQTIFPEVELDKIKHNLGMDVTIVTTAKTDAEAKELLRLLGMPFSS
ncbi:MAG: 50S ribosomal protein L5 [Verrucomicrobiae bacterium]|nr:50S ribosomal protein L5 [Verrucomicrobiae bacterium]